MVGFYRKIVYIYCESKSLDDYKTSHKKITFFYQIWWRIEIDISFLFGSRVDCDSQYLQQKFTYLDHPAL